MSRQLLLLGGIAVATAVIVVGLVVGLGALGPRSSSDPNPSTPGTSAGAADASPTAVPSAPPCPPTTSSPVPTTLEPSLKPRASAPTALPSGTVLTITVNGTDYLTTDVDQANICLTPTGTSLRIEATGAGTSHVVYKIPAALLPPGTKISGIDTRVCGSAGGAFWEIYGPASGEPNELEKTQPLEDGCWHFKGATGEFVDVFVVADSFLSIDRIIFTVTIG